EIGVVADDLPAAQAQHRAPWRLPVVATVGVDENRLDDDGVSRGNHPLDTRTTSWRRRHDPRLRAPEGLAPVHDELSPHVDLEVVGVRFVDHLRDVLIVELCPAPHRLEVPFLFDHVSSSDLVTNSSTPRRA